MTRGKNSLDNKAMDYTFDVLKVCYKSHKLLYLPKNTTILKFMYMQNYLKKPQGLGVTAIQFMEIGEKMKYLMCKHLMP